MQNKKQSFTAEIEQETKQQPETLGSTVQQEPAEDLPASRHLIRRAEPKHCVSAYFTDYELKKVRENARRAGSRSLAQYVHDTLLRIGR